MPDISASSQVAETYYDSGDADAFYANIWGGEDIHVGLYQEGDTITQASERTVQRMADRLNPAPGPDTRALDLGAGYGGAARSLARRFGCQTVCLNISNTQNAYNQRITEQAGLTDKVSVRHGSFEQVPYEADSFDLVWSQDSFLHSSWKDRVMAEAARVLKPGGQLIFTDPMQADDCPDGVLADVLARIHLDSMGSFALYRRLANEQGLEEVGVEDHTPQLGRHYGRVRQDLQNRYGEMVEKSSKDYVDRMLAGLGHWVAAADQGYLAWGILHFRKA